jgi:hypothetical protein
MARLSTARTLIVPLFLKLFQRHFVILLSREATISLQGAAMFGYCGCRWSCKSPKVWRADRCRSRIGVVGVSLGWAGLIPRTFGTRPHVLGVSIPNTNLGQVSAHPNKSMNNIKALLLAIGIVLIDQTNQCSATWIPGVFQWPMKARQHRSQPLLKPRRDSRPVVRDLRGFGSQQASSSYLSVCRFSSPGFRCIRHVKRLFNTSFGSTILLRFRDRSRCAILGHE